MASDKTRPAVSIEYVPPSSPLAGVSVMRRALINGYARVVRGRERRGQWPTTLTGEMILTGN